MFCQLSSYFKKHLLIDVQQNVLPETFRKFNGIICIEFANLQNSYISKKKKTVVNLPTGVQI